MLSTQQSARPPLSMLSSSVMGLGMSVDTAYAFLKTTKTVSYTSARVSKRVCLAAYSTPYFVPDTMGYRPLPLQIKLCVSGRWRFDCVYVSSIRTSLPPEAPDACAHGSVVLILAHLCAVCSRLSHEVKSSHFNEGYTTLKL